MGDRLDETIWTATSGPVIIGAASFWYSITKHTQQLKKNLLLILKNETKV